MPRWKETGNGKAERRFMYMEPDVVMGSNESYTAGGNPNRTNVHLWHNSGIKLVFKFRIHTQFAFHQNVAFVLMINLH